MVDQTEDFYEQKQEIEDLRASIMDRLLDLESSIMSMQREIKSDQNSISVLEEVAEKQTASIQAVERQIVKENLKHKESDVRDKIHKLEEGAKRMKDDLIAKQTALQDVLEKKIFNSIGAIISSNVELTQTSQSSFNRLEDNIALIRGILAQQNIKQIQLQELNELKEQYDSVVEGLAAKIELSLENNLEMKLCQKFSLLHEFQAYQKETDDAISGLKYSGMSVLREVRALESRSVEKFLSKTEFKEREEKLATQEQLTLVNEEIKNLAKADEVKKELVRLDDGQKTIQAIINDTLATKKLVAETDQKLRQKCKETYVTQVEHEVMARTQSQIIADQEKAQKGFFDIQEKLAEVLHELRQKCDIRELKKLEKQLNRFALYEDYKELYNKVVPPVAEYQNIIESFSKQVAQFELMISRFDENLQLRALKCDFNAVMQHLRNYVKLDQFDQAVVDINKTIEAQKEEISQLDQKIQQTGSSTLEVIKVSARESEKRLDRKFVEKLECIPGYQALTVSQKLGFTPKHKHEEFCDQESLQNILKTKAEVSEVRRLQDEKTNKTDTQSQMNYLEILHRMLTHVCVLITEICRLKIQNKHETEASKTLQSKTLYEQTVQVQQWIQKFDSSQINEQTRQPVFLANFTDQALSKIMPPLVNDSATQNFFTKTRGSLASRPDNYVKLMSIGKYDRSVETQISPRRQVLSPAYTNRQIRPLDLSSIQNLVPSSPSLTNRLQRVHQAIAETSSQNQEQESVRGEDSHIRQYADAEEYLSSTFQHFVSQNEQFEQSTESRNNAFQNNKLMMAMESSIPSSKNVSKNQIIEQMSNGQLSQLKAIQLKIPESSAQGKRLRSIRHSIKQNAQ